MNVKDQAMPGRTGEPSATGATRQGTDIRRTLMSNGLRVVCHRSSRPTTMIGLTFHAGSRHEAPGGHGLAHLAEHVFAGCRSSRGRQFRDECADFGLVEEYVATNFDFTWFIAEVAPEAAPGIAALMTEMADPQLRVVSRNDIDVQRRVILSELDELEGAGWARGHRRLLSLLFGDMHPYGHLIGGSRDDLVSLTSHEVEKWSERYFCPNNAVLAISGPHDRDLLLRSINRNIIGSRSSRPVRIPSGSNALELPETSRSETIWAERPNAALRRAWCVPEAGRGLAPMFLKVFMECILARLTQKADTGIDGQITCNYKDHILCGLAEIQITDLCPEHIPHLTDVMNACLDELADPNRCVALLSRWHTAADATQPKRYSPLELIQTLTFETFRSDPQEGESNSALSLPDMKAQDLVAFVQRWILGRHVDILLKPPPPPCTASPLKAPIRKPTPPPMRTLMSWPEVIPVGRPSEPDLVVVKRTDDVRSVCTACFRAGFGADVEYRRGLSRFALELSLHRPLDADGRTAPQIAATFDARIHIAIDPDLSLIQIDAPSTRTEDAIVLLKRLCSAMCDIPGTVSLQRTREVLHRVANRDCSSPSARVLHVMPTFLFERDHPYCCSWTGLEPQESLEEISGQMVSEFALRFLHPHAATFVIVSPLDEYRVADLTTIEDSVPARQASSAGSITVPERRANRPSAAVPHLNVAGAAQTVISGATVLEPGFPGPDNFNIYILNRVLGAPQSGRFNNLIRTRLGHTYGVRTRVQVARGPQVFLAGLAVAPSVARRCIDLLQNELAAIRQEPGLLAAKIDQEKSVNKRILINQFSKVENIVSVLLHCVSLGRDCQDVLTFREGIDAVSVEGIGSVLDRFFKPDDIVWMTAGADPGDEEHRFQG